MRGIQNLPDCYRKGTGSNNYKLLELNEQATRDLQEDIQDVLETLDLNQASGKTLDLYGDMMEQGRGLLNDEQYRYMILCRIGRNAVQGDYNSIMQVLMLMLGSRQNEVTLNDLEIVEDEQPCTVRLTKFPVHVLTDAGFSSRQAAELIKTLLPVGVRLLVDNFEGTFEFADSANVYDESAGFGNIEQTIGGYLGLYFGDDDDIPVLPI